ncbi:hypothetical protein H311_01848 [Anncaliia algerae PRA109]|nr:hypothetical protein H311_01848 [Anncaliia algerae PRA109]
MKRLFLVLYLILQSTFIFLNIYAVYSIINQIHQMDNEAFPLEENKYYFYKIIEDKKYNINEKIALHKCINPLLRNIVYLVTSIIIYLASIEKNIIHILEKLLSKIYQEKVEIIEIYKCIAISTLIFYFFIYSFEFSIIFTVKILLIILLCYIFSERIVPSKKFIISPLLLILYLFMTFCLLFILDFSFFIFRLAKDRIEKEVSLIPYELSKKYFDKIYYLYSKREILILNLTIFNTRRLFLTGMFDKLNDKELSAVILHEAGHIGFADGRFMVAFVSLIYALIFTIFFYFGEQIANLDNKTTKRLNICMIIISYPLIKIICSTLANIFTIYMEEKSNKIVIKNNFQKYFINAQIKAYYENQIPNKLSYIANILLFDHPNTNRLINLFGIK